MTRAAYIETEDVSDIPGTGKYQVSRPLITERAILEGTRMLGCIIPNVDHEIAAFLALAIEAASEKLAAATRDRAARRGELIRSLARHPAFTDMSNRAIAEEIVRLARKLPKDGSLPLIEPQRSITRLCAINDSKIPSADVIRKSLRK